MRQAEFIVREKKCDGYVLVVKKINKHPNEESMFDSYDHYFVGYVFIPKTHPLHVKPLTSMDYPTQLHSVHGGVTYCDWAKYIDVEHGQDFWAIGFDCHHYGDNPIINDDQFTYQEVVKLYKMLKEVEETSCSHTD